MEQLLRGNATTVDLGEAAACAGVFNTLGDQWSGTIFAPNVADWKLPSSSQSRFEQGDCPIAEHVALAVYFVDEVYSTQQQLLEVSADGAVKLPSRGSCGDLWVRSDGRNTLSLVVEGPAGAALVVGDGVVTEVAGQTVVVYSVDSVLHDSGACEGAGKSRRGWGKAEVTVA